MKIPPFSLVRAKMQLKTNGPLFLTAIYILSFGRANFILIGFHLSFALTGLIGDLFPSINVPRKRDVDFEALIKKAALSLSLQPEEAFITKCVQLQELIEVRHSVFVLGNAGTGKSQVNIEQFLLLSCFVKY